MCLTCTPLVQCIKNSRKFVKIRSITFKIKIEVEGNYFLEEQFKIWIEN